jgi:ubiquinone/menaquinone biosynthesis C-methylase UbiE
MFDLEDHHWWFQGRIQLMRRMVERHCPKDLNRKPRLLDLGCGTGLFVTEQNRNKTVFGLDFSSEALEFTRTRGVTRLVCADSQMMPFESESFDMVTAFDLIEHVERDDALIAEAYRVLRPGGVMLVAVPAHPFLLGEHDSALHHKRRYSWNQFDRLFSPDIWLRRRMTWTFSLIYPVAALIRSVRNLFPAPKRPTADTRSTPVWMNRALISWHRLENSWAETHDLPFGLSMLTVREKIATSSPVR